jgi:hypothetical protein
VPVVHSPRRLLILLALAALTAAVLQGVTGVSELALYAAPFLLIFGLLVNGRYLGEERILARRRAAVPRLRAALECGWTPSRDRPLASLLQRAPRAPRGPPAAAFAS